MQAKRCSVTSGGVDHSNSPHHQPRPAGRRCPFGAFRYLGSAYTSHTDRGDDVLLSRSYGIRASATSSPESGFTYSQWRPLLLAPEQPVVNKIVISKHHTPYLISHLPIATRLLLNFLYSVLFEAFRHSSSLAAGLVISTSAAAGCRYCCVLPALGRSR